MIAPEELRIGNLLIDDKTKKKVIVDAVTSETICVRNTKGELVYYVFRHYLSPIPLSPEILEKAGFEIQYEMFFIRNNLTLRYITKQHILDPIDLEVKFFRLDGFCDIYYIHQLQNLFYSLTGTDLIINL